MHSSFLLQNFQLGLRLTLRFLRCIWIRNCPISTTCQHYAVFLLRHTPLKPLLPHSPLFQYPFPHLRSHNKRAKKRGELTPSSRQWRSRYDLYHHPFLRLLYRPESFLPARLSLRMLGSGLHQSDLGDLEANILAWHVKNSWVGERTVCHRCGCGSRNDLFGTSSSECAKAVFGGDGLWCTVNIKPARLFSPNLGAISPYISTRLPPSICSSHPIPADALGIVTTT